MKKKILIGLLLMIGLSFGTGSAENWVYFANDDDGNWFIDTDATKGDGLRFIITTACVPDSPTATKWYRREISIVPSLQEYKYLLSEEHQIGVKEYTYWDSWSSYNNYNSLNILSKAEPHLTGPRREGFQSLEDLIKPAILASLPKGETFPGNWVKLNNNNNFSYNTESIVDKGNGIYQIDVAWIRDDEKELRIRRKLINRTLDQIAETRVEYLSVGKFREPLYYYREKKTDFVTPRPGSMDEQILKIVKAGVDITQKGKPELIETQFDRFE